MKLNTIYLQSLLSFSSERMKIWEKKSKGLLPPYTNDPILQKYRFCNIYRQLDKQTILIHKDLDELKTNFPLWLLNLSFHRFICNPQTVSKIGRLSFDEKENLKVYEKLKNLPSPKYGTAYIFPISVIQAKGIQTRGEFFCLYLPKMIKKILPLFNEFKEESPYDAMIKICNTIGFNFRFHFTEILIDVAYLYPEKIDLNKRIYVGPGALPTLKKLSNANPMDTCVYLATQRFKDFPYLKQNGKEIMLTAENWEGICCEYRKYENLKKGVGRKRIYDKMD